MKERYEPQQTSEYSYMQVLDHNSRIYRNQASTVAKHNNNLRNIQIIQWGKIFKQIPPWIHTSKYGYEYNMRISEYPHARWTGCGNALEQSSRSAQSTNGDLDSLFRLFRSVVNPGRPTLRQHHVRDCCKGGILFEPVWTQLSWPSFPRA